MPRNPRDDAPGAAHHVMVRGIERRRIFRDDADREELLRRLSILVPALGFRCFAWALLPNHFHLVVRSGSPCISRLMARLGTGYARYFNERHDRVGHLFQNRFRSRRAIDDGDLMGLVLYAIRNPLDAGLVANPRALEDFRWCSLGALVGRRVPYPFEATDETLALFDADPSRARRRLRSWLGAPAGAGPRDCPVGALGPAVPATRVPPDSIEVLVREVCASFAVAEHELRSWRRSARIAAARATLVSRASRELGLSGAQIARCIGITRAGVSRMLTREQCRRTRTS